MKSLYMLPDEMLNYIVGCADTPVAVSPLQRNDKTNIKNPR